MWAGASSRASRRRADALQRDRIDPKSVGEVLKRRRASRDIRIFCSRSGRSLVDGGSRVRDGRAYGLRNLKALRAMIMLCCGGMEFTLPLPVAA